MRILTNSLGAQDMRSFLSSRCMHVGPNFSLWSSIGKILAASCSELRFKREIHTGGNSRCAINPEIKEVVGMSLPHT